MYIFIQMTTFYMPLALPLIWSFNIFWLFLMHFIILQQQAIMQTIGDLVAITTIRRFWMKHALCKQSRLATASNLQQPCSTLQGNWKFLDRLLVTRPVRLSQLCVRSILESAGDYSTSHDLYTQKKTSCHWEDPSPQNTLCQPI